MNNKRPGHFIRPDRKDIKSTRAMAKEFGNQLEEASVDQRWGNLTIRITKWYFNNVIASLLFTS